MEVTYSPETRMQHRNFWHLNFEHPATQTSLDPCRRTSSDSELHYRDGASGPLGNPWSSLGLPWKQFLPKFQTGWWWLPIQITSHYLRSTGNLDLQNWESYRNSIPTSQIGSAEFTNLPIYQSTTWPEPIFCGLEDTPRGLDYPNVIFKSLIGLMLFQRF